MTVSSDLDRKQYATNGTTGPWSVPFPFIADTHLQVVYADADGVATTLTLSVDYTVTGAGDPAGGTVTTVASYATGGTITVLRDVPFEQQSDYVNGDQFPAETLEQDLDLGVMRDQQLLETLGRTLRVPSSEDPIAEIASALLRADRCLSFDTAGVPSVTPYTVSQINSVLAAFYASMATAADAISYIAAGNGAVSESVQTRLRREPIYPEDWGAFGDGASHPLSATFATLAAAQAKYGSAAVALTDETDGVVINALCALGTIGIRCQGSPGAVYLITRRIKAVQGTWCRGARSWAGAASTESGTGTSTLRYVGPLAADTAVALLSDSEIGIEPANNLQNVVFDNWTLDGNDLAAYTGVFVRSCQGNQLDNLTFTRARTCHAVVLDGWVTGPRNWRVFQGRGAAFWLGKNPWSGTWASTYTVDNITLVDWFAYWYGCDTSFNPYNTFSDTGGAYPTSANVDATCGFGIYGSRHVRLVNCQAARGDGVPLVIKPYLHGPIVIDGGYFEFNSRSSGASQPWGSWTELNADGGSWGIVIRDMSFSGTVPHHRFIGTTPREDQGPRFENCPTVGTVVADVGTPWGAFNSDQTLVVAGEEATVPMQSQGGFQSQRNGPIFRYQEGSFVPALAGSTIAGAGWTYGANSSITWTRVGRLVTFSGQVTLTAKSGTATGAIVLGAFPYTVANGQGYNAACNVSKVANLTTAVVSLTGYMIPNQAVMALEIRTAAAAGETAMALADLSNITTFVVGGSYFTNDPV